MKTWSWSLGVSVNNYGGQSFENYGRRIGRRFSALVGAISVIMALSLSSALHAAEYATDHVLVKFKATNVTTKNWRPVAAADLDNKISKFRTKHARATGVERAFSKLAVPKWREGVVAKRKSQTSIRSPHETAEYALDRWHIVKIEKNQDINVVIQQFKADPSVEAVEFDYYVSKRAIPNDPQFAEQWALQNIGSTGGKIGADIKAVQAWDATTGRSDVIVAVLDTGIDYSRPDIAANIWVNTGETGFDSLGKDKQSNAVDDDGNGCIDDVYGCFTADGWARDQGGYKGVSPVWGIRDPDGHGTAVASIIGAVGNNGVGMTGVAWNVKLMAVGAIFPYIDLSGSELGTVSSYTRGIRYAVDNGAQIINNSWGLLGDFFRDGNTLSLLEDAVNYAAINDVLLVNAVDNGGSDNVGDDMGTGLLDYPISFNSPNSINVAATDHSDSLTDFTNYGKNIVHLGAPGKNIRVQVPLLDTGGCINSAFKISPPLCNSSGTTLVEGSSYAVPHVAGAAALLLSQNPALTAVQLKARILATVDPIYSLRDKLVSGGRLNIASALAVANMEIGLQPAITIGQTSAEVPVKFANDGTVVSLQFDVEYEARSSTIPLVFAGFPVKGDILFADHTVSAAIVSSTATHEVLRVVIAPTKLNEVIPSGVIARIPFNILTELNHDIPLRISNVVTSDNSARSPTIASVTDGILLGGGGTKLATGTTLPTTITGNTIIEGDYLVNGTVTIATTATLAIKPGSNLRFGPGAKIRVEGKLSVAGTSDARITFTAATPPAVWDGTASWGGIEIVSDYAENLIDYALVEWAACGVSFVGQQKFDAFGSHWERARGTLSNSILRKNVNGACVRQLASPVIGGRNEVYQNKIGILVEGDSYEPAADPTPLIRDNDVYGNTQYSLYATSFGKTDAKISAANNWWGSAAVQDVKAGIFDALSVTDTLHGSYAIAPTVQFLPFLDSANGQEVPGLFMAGVLDRDTVIPANSTANVYGDLTVPVGITLIVEEGATLRFTGAKANFNYDVIEFMDGVENGSNLFAIPRMISVNRSHLIIKGSVDVKSTTAHRVTFTSGYSSPAVADWGGIRLYGAQTLSNVNIEWARFGIWVQDSPVGIDKAITNSVLRNNDLAVLLEGGYRLDISRSDINSNRYGVMAAGTSAGSKLRISENTNVSGNIYGVFLRDTTSTTIFEFDHANYFGNTNYNFVAEGCGYLFPFTGARACNSSFKILTSNVWWGTTDTAVIASKIIDATDCLGCASPIAIPTVDHTSASAAIVGAPVAKAGIDIVRKPWDQITLDGTGSFDTDGVISTYSWRQTSGTTAWGLPVTNTPIATYMLDGNNAPLGNSIVTFELTVTDDQGNIGADTINITVVNNLNPIATITENSVVTSSTSIIEGEKLTLSGGSSNDGDGTISSYAWSQIGGDVFVALIDSNKPSMFFVAPVVDRDATVQLQLTVSDDRGAAGSTGVSVLIRNKTQPLSANAGADIIVNEGSSVTLDGGQSLYSTGHLTSINWQQSAGGVTTILSNINQLATSFTAPDVTQDTVLTFTLALIDDAGQSATDNVSVTVRNINKRPAAIAGADVSSTAGDTVTLNGNSSFDTDGSITSFAWRQLSGPAVTLSSSSSPSTTFVVPSVTATTTFSFDLTVTDNGGLSSVDSVVITAAPSVAIELISPSDQIASVGSSVVVQVVASSTKGLSLTYTATGLPAGVSINSTTGRIAGVVGFSAASAYTTTFSVTDGAATVTGTFNWTIVGVANIAPVANAGADQTVNAGSSVTLGGSDSNDSDGAIVSYSWAQVGGSPTVAITNASLVSATLVAPSVTVATTLTFQLTVTDNGGATGQDTIDVLVMPISGGATTTAKLAAGYSRGLSLRPDGSVWQWGENVATPAQISGLTGITNVAAALGHSLALNQSGNVWGWGANTSGELGNGTFVSNGTPTNGQWTNVSKVSAGWSTTQVVKTDGTVWSSGSNSNGQLGDGTLTNRATPVQASGLSNVVMVAAGSTHVLALKSDGSVWAWGTGILGELGDGITGYSQRLTPILITGLSNVIAISAGYSHSVALKADGTVVEWGYNGMSIVGTSPVAVSGLTGVTAIEAGKGMHALALKSDGTVWTWGQNGFGQLGNNTTTNSAAPVQVSGLTGIVGVAAGYEYSAAIKTDGTVWTWGRNNVGQLGDGTTTNRLTAVQVVGLPSGGGTPAPTVTISASSASIASGQSSLLTWSTTNATSCTASNGWSGTQATSGNQTVSPTTTTTYTLACIGAGGTTTQAATVTVTAAPIVTLTANPALIASGSSSTLTWSSTNATSCSATGGWTSSTATSGSQAVSPTATTTYTLSCTGAGGSASQSATVTVSAASYTLTATPTTVAPNGAVNVSWTTPSGTTNSSVDWIGLFAVGALDTSYLAYRYTNAAVAGTAQFAMPSTTGSYEFRYLLNDGYTSVVTSNIVTVATLPLPIITISASPASLAASGSTTLTWSTTNASSCSASGSTDWTGAKATSGTQAVSLIALTTYTLTCTGTGGTGNGSVTVSVGTASDTVWVEDALPAGATGVGDADGWTWINSGPTPYSGTLAHKAAGYTGTHQHYFSGASTPLNIGVGDSLFTYVYLDPNDTPAEVMLQFFDGAGWDHRAYWGANSIAWGTDGTVSRKYMGALPATAQWVRLSVPASAVGLEGVSVTGIAYTLYNGFAAWDRSGKSAAVASPTPTVTISANPTSVASGGSSTLTWSSTDATSCTASGGWTGTKVTSGSQAVTVSATTTYTLACTGAGGTGSASTTVTVVPGPTLTVTANPATISTGGSSTISWTALNATSCSATGGWTSSTATSGSQAVSPTTTTTYVMSCTGAGGSANASATITVGPGPTYVVTVSPTTLVQGSSVHVTWATPTTTNSGTDYVGLFVPGGATEITGYYKYTSGAQTGTWDVIPPSSGTFEIRYCLNNGYTCPKIVGPITVAMTGTVPTVMLAASPASITSGSSSTLTWSSTNATSCSATGGWTSSTATSGSQAVSPTTTTTYTLSCTGTGGTANQSVTVTVVPGPTLTFSANPASVPQGTSSSLSWSTTNASSCTASNGWSGTKGTSGLESVIPSTTTSYTLTCTGAGGTVAQTVTVTVTAAAPVVTLSASPTSLTSGGSSTLTWSSTNATSCTASNGWTGSKTTSGSQLVSPTTTTTYTLACTGSGGSDSRSVTVTVGGNVNYTVTILPSSQSSNSSKALAISDLGDVVGTDGANALVWINGQLSTVGTADNAYDVNSAGDIVGVEDGWAVRYRNGVRTFLVTQNFSTAKGVNTTGDIVGYSPNGAFLYRNDVLTNLGLFGWSNSQARGVNDAGQIVGTLFGTSSTRAFIWNSGSIQEMPPIAGNYTYATGININGVVVGLTSIALTGSDRHVFVWQNGTMTDLGVSVSDVYANEHYAINDAGTVVGPTFVYQNGTVQASSELMGLLPAAPAGMTWTSLFFEDVNNPGRIVGHAQAINWTTFEIKVVPVLLTPAP